ncbi:MAG: hypothetical protein QNL68_09460 [Akkermansiaceae bacterium]|jgi:hypothetical protein
MVLYGSSNSTTHNNTNYPLVFAGGNQLGLKHGAHHRFDSNVPLANLFVTMMNRLGLQTSNFVDSTGELTELVG